MKHLAYLPLLIALMAHTVLADDEFDTLESARSQAICKAVDQINSQYAGKYQLLLQRATLKGDTATALSLQALIADLETPQSLKDAKATLVKQPWIFTAPQGNYRSTRVFLPDGSWTSSDESQKGTWKIEPERLLITLNASPKPEAFHLPLKAERWRGTGVNNDEIFLNATKSPAP